MAENQNAGVVEMSKNFPVPVERLFEAWNDPQQLKQWWHPLNNHLENVKNDLREGGAIEYEFQDHKLHITGNYKEVNKNQKLVYSWNWELEDENVKNADYTLSIDFIPEENGSRLNIRQEGFADERATHPHKEGWDQGLASLQEFLSNQAEAGESKNMNTSESSSRSESQDEQSNKPGQMKNAGGSTGDQLGPYDYPGQDQGSLSENAAGSQVQKEKNGEGEPANIQNENRSEKTGEPKGRELQQGDTSSPGTNTSNPTQQDFNPAKPGNSVNPEY